MKEPIATEENKAIEGALLEIIGFHQTIKRSKNILIAMALIIGGSLLSFTANIQNSEQLIKDSMDEWDHFFVGLMSGISTGLFLWNLVSPTRGYRSRKAPYLTI